MTMRMLFIFLVLMPSTLIRAQEQEQNLELKITLADPPSSCALLDPVDLNLGEVIRPFDAGVDGNARWDPVSGEHNSNLTVNDIGELGSFTVTASHTASADVELLSPPTEFTRTGGSLDFEQTWAHAPESGGTFELIAGNSYKIEVGGPGNTVTHYFRYGGTVSRIESSDVTGPYIEVVTITVTCN